jgi:hypothetical protein
VGAWRSRRKSRREVANGELTQEIREIQKAVKHRYGSPRVTEPLRRGGRSVGHNRVARLMRAGGLQAWPKRRFRVTTKASASLPVAKNVLGRNFEVSELKLSIESGKVQMDDPYMKRVTTVSTRKWPIRSGVPAHFGYMPNEDFEMVRGDWTFEIWRLNELKCSKRFSLF